MVNFPQPRCLQRLSMSQSVTAYFFTINRAKYITRQKNLQQNIFKSISSTTFGDVKHFGTYFFQSAGVYCQPVENLPKPAEKIFLSNAGGDEPEDRNIFNSLTPATSKQRKKDTPQ